MKDKWIGKCSLCKKENQKLATIQLSDKSVYTIWLKRMCQTCRGLILYHFFKTLSTIDSNFEEAVQIFNPDNHDFEKENEKK